MSRFSLVSLPCVSGSLRTSLTAFAVVFFAALGWGQAEETQEEKKAPPVGVLAPSGDAVAMTPEVKAAIAPLFQRIRDAKTNRVVAEMELTAAINGEPVETQAGTYQIVSAGPNRVSAILKTTDEEMQMVADGEKLYFAPLATAYVEAKLPKSLDALASDVNTPFGPFPEYILSLSLAGVDAFPAFFRTAGGMGISDGEREELPGTQRIHIRRGDGVVIDLWVQNKDEASPVRLSVDMTGMLQKMNNANIPEGFTYVLTVNFKRWEVGAEVKDEMFQFKPNADAEKFDSLDALIASLSGVVDPSSLVGTPAPEFTTEGLDGKPFDLKQHRDKQIVVLDFWATWCGPCVQALPKIIEVTNQFADKDVAFYAVNIGEEKTRINDFLKQHNIAPSVLFDLEGEIARAYGANAIPQTVIIGKDGRIEAIHVGFNEIEALAKDLTTELETLAAGKHLVEKSEAGEAANPPAAE